MSYAPFLFTDEQLSELLVKSRRNNETRGISGLSLYSDGNILQVLEREKETVVSMYGHIGEDRRHSGILLMMEGETEIRNFPDYSMGFRKV